MIGKIIDDLREIKRITFAEYDSVSIFEVGSLAGIGEKRVTKILPYEENGEMAPIIYFAIYVEDKIICRVNGRYIDTVWYKEEGK